MGTDGCSAAGSGELPSLQITKKVKKVAITYDLLVKMEESFSDLQEELSASTKALVQIGANLNKKDAGAEPLRIALCSSSEDKVVRLILHNQ